MKSLLIKTLLLIALMAPLGLFLTEEVAADTLIDQSITRSTRWTIQGSPYVIKPRENAAINIGKNATLQIDPGVTVKFHPRTAMTVEGRLIARGDSQRPVLFTSFYDHPEPFNTAHAGDWYGLFLCGQPSSLTYTTIRYAGRLGFGGYGEAVSLFLNGHGHQLDHTTVEKGDGNGLWLHYAYGVSIQSSSIKEHRHHGILMNHSQRNDLFRNQIEQNGQDGLHLINLADALIRYNRIRQNQGNGIYLRTLAGPDIHDNQIEQNDQNGLSIDTGYPRIHHNQINRNQNGIVIRHNWPQNIEENDIYRNHDFDFQVLQFNRKYTQVNAMHNWWGNSFGPQRGKVTAHIDTRNYRQSPATRFVR